MILYSPITTIYYVAEDPTRSVDDLVAVSPIYKECVLSWSNPSNPGQYNIYWKIASVWVNSNISVSSTSITIEPPRDATAIQLRTDDIYPSNSVDITFHDIPETRALTASPRYDGVYLDWDIPTLSNERVQVKVDNVTEFFDAAQSYFHPSGGAFEVRFAKGSGTDIIYSGWSNTETVFPLAPPPDRVEPTSPCDFYLGVNRAGDQVFHMCNPSVVPETPPIVETGKTATDWFQDWVGINVDYGSDTYFHSMFKYIYCTQAVRLSSYTDVDVPGANLVRRFDFTGAQDLPTGANTTFTLNQGRMLMIVEVDTAGYRRLASSALVREFDVTDNNYTTNVLYYGNRTGFGDSGAYYNLSTNYIRSNRAVRYLEIYEFNVQANGLDLSYVDESGADDGIRLDENTFEVAGNDFSGMFLCYCNSVSDGGYVDSMNLSDAIVANTGEVDTLGIYHGSGGDAVQILGSSGGSGWDVTMETGLIKRGGKTWFNAGRGRTRLKFSGISGSDSSRSFRLDIPEHTASGPENVSYYSATGLDTSETIIIDPEITESSELLAYALVPISYSGGQDDWLDLETAQKPMIGFSSFNQRTLIHTFKKSVRADKVILDSGDPWWLTDYKVTVDVYLKRASSSRYVIECDIEYRGFQGSGGQANSVWLPGFSVSFVGLS